MSTIKTTPMVEQYLRIKEENKDALLFFRMGDFYELFFEDAETAARELQITLTSRNPNADLKMPMCGVPHHAVEEYLRQLIDKGYKVAICDQVEDPRTAKGLVKRAVTRVLTPGTVVEDGGLKAKSGNYLAALYWDGGAGAGGLAWIDFSTGEWSGLFSRQLDQLQQWMLKLDPRELLVPEGLSEPAPVTGFRGRVNRLSETPFFHRAGGEKRILKAQGVSSLAPLDLENKPQLVQACGALLAYLHQTQKQDLDHLSPFRPLNLSRHLLLDEVTERNLELFKTLDGSRGPGTLWHVVDRTKTPMGGRLLHSRLRQPWRDLGPVQENLDMVGCLLRDDGLRNRIRQHLDQVYDLGRLSTRILLNRSTPKDFVSLRTSLSALPAMNELLRELPGQDRPRLWTTTLTEWDELSDVAELLQHSLVDSPPPVITEGGLFQSGYDQQLDEILELTEHGEDKLRQLLEHERQAFDLPKLKLGYNRVFGYFFELSRAHKGPVPEHFARRQTLANSERYLTPQLKELEERLFSASEKRKVLEYELFQTLRARVAKERKRLLHMARVLARLDVWQGLAETARQEEWVRPELHTGLEIEIKGGRHPAVESCQGRATYIPNDVALGDRSRLLLITGPNMAGKSTVLRQTAIIALLAQSGSFVPAAAARIGLCDRIFTRVGASDNLARGQSTFMVEMTETARILRQAGKRSLVLLDELGRGTSPFDGLAPAWSVVEELCARGEGGVRTLFATHYHELTDLEDKIPAVRNFNIAVTEWKGDIVFLRRLLPGPADRSYGIEVARLAGVPRNVVHRAGEILSELEAKSDRLRGGVARQTTLRGSLLPELLREEAPAQQTSPHGGDTLLQELKALNLDRLTPLEAMNILHTWKGEWDDA